LVLGPVAARIHQTLATEEQQAQADLEQVMRGRRYFALQRELRAWGDDPPIADHRPAGDVERFLHKAQRKVRRRLKWAPQAAEPDVAMHRARKAAKRARYAAELAEPQLGPAAHKVVKWAKKVQTRLGERQDDVVAAEFLLRVGAAAGTTPGENGFTFGILHAREIERAHQTGG
jgi:CHAD domain-containing protein